MPHTQNMIHAYCNGGHGKIHKNLYTKRLLLYVLPLKGSAALQWAIFLRHEQSIVGHCGLTEITKDHAEVWYTIAHGWRNHGYAAEALDALITFAFCTLHLTSLEAFILQDNYASMAVAQHAGMHLVHTLENHWYQNGTLHTVYVFNRMRKQRND